MHADLLSAMRLRLLQGRTWRYLRYLHARESLSAVADEVETVCVCGAGHGIAELALAIEFPHITFTLTDIVNRTHGYPNYHDAMILSWNNAIPNMRFSVWNTLQATQQRFDLVASTEMLEHIKEDDLAARNMRQAAQKYIYCLVPFADAATNNNERMRARAWERFEHYVYGYDKTRLTELFPDPVHVQGTYGMAGRALRETLHALEPDAVAADQAALEAEAQADLGLAVPETLEDGLGIKILSRAPLD